MTETCGAGRRRQKRHEWRNRRTFRNGT